MDPHRPELKEAGGCHRATRDRFPRIAHCHKKKPLKKIVIISGLRVWPVASGGQLRTSGVASALARIGYDVLVYSLTGRRADYQRYRPWRKPRLVETMEPRLSEETYLGLAPAIEHAWSRYSQRPRKWMLSRTARGAVPEGLAVHLSGAVAIIADHAYISPPYNVAGRQSTPWYLLSHQLEHRLLLQGNAADKSFAGTMEAHERNAARLFTDVFACAEEDQKYFRLHDSSGRMHVPIIRCAVDPEQYAWTDAERQRTRAQLGLTDDDTVVVFAGSRYEPNNEALDALKQFASEQKEFLARHRLRFLILGSMEPTAYVDGALIATGRVPRVLPYFAAADAGLNPIVRGAGANVKLFEYLASRLPVISTSFGVRGTGLAPGADYIEFEPASLREALEHFMTDRSRDQWRDFAGQVWQRHRQTAEIESSVRAAVSAANGFPGP